MRYRYLTEFGYDVVPCKLIDKLNERLYHIEYFDNVKGESVRAVVLVDYLENLYEQP